MEQLTEIKVRDVNGDKKYILDAFRKDVLVIGRSRECDIVVENPKVSGNHGCFFMQNGNWYYQDLNSTNGSSINGSTIMSTILINGAKLALDKKQWPDSCVIEIKFTSQNQPAPYQNGSNGPFQNGNNPAMTYNQMPNNGYQTPNGGYPYMGGNNYATPYGGGYHPNGLGTPGMQNAWGYVAAALWSVIGVIFVINLIRSLKVLGYLGEIFDADGGVGIILIAFFVLYVLIVIGTVTLPIAMFTYSKKNMASGAGLIAGGYTGIFVALFLLMAIEVGDAFGYLFKSSYFLMLLAAAILYIVGLISLSNGFKKSYRKQAIYNSYYTPIICFIVAWVLIIVIYTSLTGRYGNLLDDDLSLYGSLPIGSIWISAVWFAAIIFSCVYLHVDEVMNMSSNAGGGSNNGGRFMGAGYGSQNPYGNQQYGGNNNYNGNNYYNNYR